MNALQDKGYHIVAPVRKTPKSRVLRITVKHNTLDREETWMYDYRKGWQ